MAHRIEKKCMEEAISGERCSRVATWRSIAATGINDHRYIDARWCRIHVYHCDEHKRLWGTDVKFERVNYAPS